MTEQVSFFVRIWLAFVCWFRVLFNGEFAARVRGLDAPEAPAKAPEPEATDALEDADDEDTASALQLLGLLQREGRFVDFIEQDLSGFGDEDIASAARLVHEGCRKAIRSRAVIEPCQTESEGSNVTLNPGFDPQCVRISGNVQGQPPYSGVLRHRGWKVQSLELPQLVGNAKPEVLQPAEVEL